LGIFRIRPYINAYSDADAYADADADAPDRKENRIFLKQKKVIQVLLVQNELSNKCKGNVGP